MRISFHVPCVPVAQPRQRTRIVAVPGRTFTQNYTPQKDPVNAFKAALQLRAEQAYGEAPLEGPLGLVLEFVMPRPGSIPKREGTGRRWRDKKPDYDNLGKAVCDALSGLVWRDDAQLAWVLTIKVEAAADEQPGVTITVATLGAYSPFPVVMGSKVAMLPGMEE